MKLYGSLVLLIIIMLSGCNLANQNLVNKDNTSTPVVQGIEEMYPSNSYNKAHPTSAYPAPVDSTDVTTVVPELTTTPDNTKGFVKGVMQLDGNPVSNAILTLADVIKSAEGGEYTAVEREISPKTTTGLDGSFSFRNVPPGRYALVYSIVIESYLLYKPGATKEAILVAVVEGQELDLGTLNFDDLPFKK